MIEDLTLRKAVEFAAQTEELGSLFYDRLAQKFADDDEICNIFKTLAEDEVAHHQQFQELLKTTPSQEQVSSRSEQRDFLKLLARTEFFMGSAGLYRNLDQIRTRKDALEKALQLEKDTWSYYMAMRDVLGENDVLQEIIDLERDHISKLIQFMVAGGHLGELRDPVQ